MFLEWQHSTALEGPQRAHRRLTGQAAGVQPLHQLLQHLDRVVEGGCFAPVALVGLEVDGVEGLAQQPADLA